MHTFTKVGLDALLTPENCAVLLIDHQPSQPLLVYQRLHWPHQGDERRQAVVYPSETASASVIYPYAKARR